MRQTDLRWLRWLTRARVRALGLIALGLASSACTVSSEAPGSTAMTESRSERVPIGDVSWYVDYEAAVAVAREQDKALWVHFGENPG